MLIYKKKCLKIKFRGLSASPICTNASCCRPEGHNQASRKRRIRAIIACLAGMASAFLDRSCRSLRSLLCSISNAGVENLSS